MHHLVLFTTVPSPSLFYFIILFVLFHLFYSEKSSAGENSYSYKLILLFILFSAYSPSSYQCETLTNLEYEKMTNNLWKQSIAKSNEISYDSNQVSFLLYNIFNLQIRKLKCIKFKMIKSHHYYCILMQSIEKPSLLPPISGFFFFIIIESSWVFQFLLHCGVCSESCDILFF